MKRSIRIAWWLPVLLSICVACSTQQVARKSSGVKTTKTILTEPGISGADFRVWVWSEPSQGQRFRQKRELIRDNEILVRSTLDSGRIAVFAKGQLTLTVDLQRLKRNPRDLAVQWILQPDTGEALQGISQPNSQYTRSQEFTIDFSNNFEILIAVSDEQKVIAEKKISASVAPLASIQIVQPAADKIINYGDRIRLIANAGDGTGNTTVVVWVVRHNAVERVLGIGSEIETDRLDMGYNTITAYTIDSNGNLLFANPVHVMIPYQAVKTRIELPKDNQTFAWNQPVLVFARGNELEYLLVDTHTPEQMIAAGPGSGFLKLALQPGQYRITFQGKFGAASHVFTVNAKPKDVALAVRVEGYVLISGKQGEWHALSKGDKIPEGFIVRAIGSGLAEIHLNNGVVYILNQENAIRILANGNIVKNLNQEELALYSLVDPENVKEVEKHLKPLIGSLEQLLKNHEIVELKSENKEDILRLLDLIFKGQLKIDEVTIE